MRLAATKSFSVTGVFNAFKAVGSEPRRLKPVGSQLTNTFAVKDGCIFECSRTSRYLRSLWKPGWVKVKGSRSTGWQWFVQGQSCMS